MVGPDKKWKDARSKLDLWNKEPGSWEQIEKWDDQHNENIAEVSRMIPSWRMENKTSAWP